MENSMGVSLKTKSYFIVLLPYFIVVLFLDIYPRITCEYVYQDTGAKVIVKILQ